MAAYRPARANPTRRPASARFREPDDLAFVLPGLFGGLGGGALRRETEADRGADLPERGDLFRRQRVEQALPDGLDVPGRGRLRPAEAFLRQPGPAPPLAGR